ncbi:hypothetical protein F5Y17DRAFT_436239 [Xylariaceae sp. FL0594]|nr:hypothetical protein F5Y17DRAFT_436239 [Xylariaceae sp. FL0594]
MARRKVIADSEDEDEGDNVQLRGAYGENNIPSPEPEPLSPHHQPLSPAAVDDLCGGPDGTDPSFFAELHNAHQELAPQQSNLIENIVRQSQRASASSGEISLPTKIKGRGANRSSGTNVTSPLAPRRWQAQKQVFSDGASEFTTPRKSAARAWEVPSSPDDEIVSHPVRNSRSKLKTYGRTGRRGSKQMSSPAAEMGARDPDFEGDDGHHKVSEDHCTELPPPPPTVRAGNWPPHHTSGAEATNFYIAQSTLTTMQRLEYQKVNASNYGHKSSGSTTVACPTPSGYSSIPPLLGEQSPAPGPQHGEAILITSSPEYFASRYSASNGLGRAVEADMGVGIAPVLQDDSPQPPTAAEPAQTIKEKRKAREMDDEDELNHGPTTGPNQVNLLQESYRPRPTKRRLATASGPSTEASMDSLRTAREQTPVVDANASSAGPHLEPVYTDPLQRQPAAGPKKRGRKKKQPVTEPPPKQMGDEGILEGSRGPLTCKNVAEGQHVVEKPKKKRGRPRKTDAPKMMETALPDTQIPPVEDELPKARSFPQSNGKSESASASIKDEKGDPAEVTNFENRGTSVDDGGTESTGGRPPLEERNTNTKATAEHGSGEGQDTKAEPETRQDMKSAQKPAQLAGVVHNKPPATPSKVVYRVGLSKRTRIAPLLKSIKK